MNVIFSYIIWETSEYFKYNAISKLLILLMVKSQGVAEQYFVQQDEGMESILKNKNGIIELVYYICRLNCTSFDHYLVFEYLVTKIAK